MIHTVGIDVGSTYTKAVVLRDGEEIVGRSMQPTGFKLAEAAEQSLQDAVAGAGLRADEIEYTVATGFGRHQVTIGDVAVTDLTASARGAAFLFPGTRTVLDIGGQTMKASRLDERAKVRSFRLNDKCAAGTGAFLEKTARYMGVFAESEVINHLSQGTAPGDIMYGAIESLVGRSVQLMKRVRMEPEFTLVGGILRFDRMVDAMRRQLDADVNVPEGDLVQFTAALGAALLGRRRLEKLREEESAVAG